MRHLGRILLTLNLIFGEFFKVVNHELKAQKLNDKIKNEFKIFNDDHELVEKIHLKDDKCKF